MYFPLFPSHLAFESYDRKEIKEEKLIFFENGVHIHSPNPLHNQRHRETHPARPRQRHRPYHRHRSRLRHTPVRTPPRHSPPPHGRRPRRLFRAEGVGDGGGSCNGGGGGVLEGGICRACGKSVSRFEGVAGGQAVWGWGEVSDFGGGRGGGDGGGGGGVV